MSLSSAFAWVAAAAGLLFCSPGRAASPHQPFRLLFSDSADVSDTWGKLHFGATPMRRIRPCEHPGFIINCCLPREDGSWEVYGHTFKRDERDVDDWERVNVWKLVRATTRDGEHFEDVEVVFEPAAGPWTTHIGIAQNPRTKELLTLKCTAHPRGYAVLAYVSSDGRSWQEYAENPVYTDGDSLGLFWSPPAECFVSTNKSFQAITKHLPDHGVPHPKLPGGKAQSRRVISVRWSRDGRHWEPSHQVSETSTQLMPEGLLHIPDEHDPPDMEFFRGIGFWYGDRSYMVVSNYAATALGPYEHGLQLDNRWWFSRDGLRWRRPYRDTDALGDAFRGAINITHNPLIIDGQVLFHFGNHLAGIKQDRISFVAARANAEFSTRPFQVPDADLFLNAASPAPERPYASEQAYIMVETLDEKGDVVPGFERQKCIFRQADRIDLPLRWGERSARELAGRTVKLRFYLRAANVYAVTGGSSSAS